MRVVLAGVGAVLMLAGCATSRYAEVWHKNPQLTGPRGPEPLATAEQNLTRAIREERAKPLVAMGDCLEGLRFGSDELKRNPQNATAVRDYNFGVNTRTDVRERNAKVRLWCHCRNGDGARCTG